MNFLFITGLYRSGTTWLQKLMNQHPSVQTCEQPCPPFYWNTKQAFLKSKGITADVPISDQFGNRIPSDEFTEWLGRYMVDQPFVDRCRTQAAAFSGTGKLYRGHLPNPEESLEWLEYWKTMHDHWLTLTPKKSATGIGSKEIIGEEFCELLVQQGVKVVLIIRDPRDVIQSLVNDSGDFMGDYRPTLYTLRMWRKSVAYAIQLQSNPNFLWLRYEDLKEDIKGQKQRMATFLGLDAQDWLERNALHNEDGTPWHPNVSGRGKTEIPQVVSQYIETVCWPEMKYLGYLQSRPAMDLANAWETFEEPKPPTHRHFQNNLSKLPEELEREQRRFELLRQDGITNAQKSRWFIHSEAYEILKEVTIESDQ